MSYLSEKELKVRLILCDPDPVATVAKTHGVSESTVRNVKMLKTKIARRVRDWIISTHYPIPVHLLDPARRFTSDQVQAIRASRTPSPQLAKHFGVAESTIRMIRTGKSYV